MFESPVSFYTDAHDNSGRYRDPSTGAPITSMSIRDFCLTSRWQPIVSQLRDLIALHGPKAAKALPEYRAIKTQLPGATLSALFSLREVVDEKSGRTMLVSRRTAHLEQHSGFLCIDIDLQDNQSLSDMRIILRTLRHRPEVALLMKSCSGTGYFALIPLAYPQYHKEQFAALLREYAALGIIIDKQCGDVTRIRFASYDDHPYINEQAIPYSGIDLGEQRLAPRAAVYQHTEQSTDDLIQRVERLVQKLELYHIDITNDYSDWFRVGFALANLPEPYGRQFFHRVSALCSKYSPTLCDRKFDTLTNPKNISLGTFFAVCRNYGVTLANDR